MNTLRPLCTLLGGAFLTLALPLFLQFRFTLGLLFLFIAIPFLVIGFGFDEPIKIRWYKYLRKKRLKIGVLNDMRWWDLENKEIYTWTDISPQAWKEGLEKLNEGKKANVKLITCKKNLEPYTIVVNPYGGVYPEYELSELGTLNKILKYVRGGGIFVNVADIPSYYAYNPPLKRRVDLAFRLSPPTYVELIYVEHGEQRRIFIPEEVVPLFRATPLTKELDIVLFNVERDNIPLDWDITPHNDFRELFPGKIEGTKVHRVARVERNIKAIVDPKVYVRRVFRGGSSTPTTPIFYLTYGDGDFLISLIFINYHSDEVKVKLKQVLCKLILGYSDMPQLNPITFKNFALDM